MSLTRDLPDRADRFLYAKSKMPEGVTMGLDNDGVKALYDRSVRIPLYWEADAFVSRATENSIYRKQAVATLGLTADSWVLDAACGTGLNFKLVAFTTF